MADPRPTGPTRVFVLGNSHTRALSLALSAGAYPDVEFEVRWLLSEKGDRSMGEMPFKEARERISALRNGDLLVLSLLGTSHNVHGLVQHDEPFWIQSEKGESEDRVPRGHTLIPRRCVAAWFGSMAKGYTRLDKLLKGCRARPFHLMPPPPGGDNKVIAERMDSYRGRPVDEDTLVLPEMRRRLWAIEKAVLDDLLCARSVEPLAPPAQAVDRLGFLAPAYCHYDGVHANAAYGGLVLQALAARATAGSQLEGAGALSEGAKR